LRPSREEAKVFGERWPLAAALVLERDRRDDGLRDPARRARHTPTTSTGRRRKSARPPTGRAMSTTGRCPDLMADGARSTWFRAPRRVRPRPTSWWSTSAKSVLTFIVPSRRPLNSFA